MSKQDSDPNCVGCPQQSACGAFNYYEFCEIRKGGFWATGESDDMSITTSDLKRINCTHFKPFEGACKIHPGARENTDYCSDFRAHETDGGQ